MSTQYYSEINPKKKKKELGDAAAVSSFFYKNSQQLGFGSRADELTGAITTYPATQVSDPCRTLPAALAVSVSEAHAAVGGGAAGDGRWRGIGQLGPIAGRP